MQGDRAFEVWYRAALALIGEDLAIGQARGIIDAYVDVFPAGTVIAPVIVDPMGRPPRFARAFCVDVEQARSSRTLGSAGSGVIIAEPEPAGDAPTAETGMPG